MVWKQRSPRSTADAKRQEMAQQLEKADGLRQGGGEAVERDGAGVEGDVQCILVINKPDLYELRSKRWRWLYSSTVEKWVS